MHSSASSLFHLDHFLPCFFPSFYFPPILKPIFTPIFSFVFSHISCILLLLLKLFYIFSSDFIATISSSCYIPPSHSSLVASLLRVTFSLTQKTKYKLQAYIRGHDCNHIHSLQRLHPTALHPSPSPMH